MIANYTRGYVSGVRLCVCLCAWLSVFHLPPELFIWVASDQRKR